MKSEVLRQDLVTFSSDYIFGGLPQNLWVKSDQETGFSGGARRRSSGGKFIAFGSMPKCEKCDGK